jgi:hypothetical protein
MTDNGSALGAGARRPDAGSGWDAIDVRLPPIQPCDDPIIQLQMGQLWAGAIGYAIGMVLLVGMLIWQFWPW